MPTTNNLQDGYYWVNLGKEWVIAYYAITYKCFFYRHSIKEPKDMKEIGERIPSNEELIKLKANPK